MRETYAACLLTLTILFLKAINEIGWTNYHWKLFVLNGFG